MSTEIPSIKERLLQEANEVHNLLSTYIEIHNTRLKKCGTLSSFLKNVFLNKTVGFEGIYKTTAQLIDSFEKKQIEIDDIGKNYSKEFNEIEKDFYRSLQTYFEALGLGCTPYIKNIF